MITLIKEILQFLPLQCWKISQSCCKKQSDGGEALGGQIVLRGVLLLLRVAQVVKSVKVKAVHEFLDEIPKISNEFIIRSGKRLT